MKTQASFVITTNLTSATAAATATSDLSDSLSEKVMIPVTNNLAGVVAFTGNISEAASKIGSIKGADIEMVLYEKVSIGTGSRANNAWLQELSDPISKATWDNYAMISPQMGKSLFDVDIFSRKDMDKYEVHPKKPVIKITSNGKSLELPILIIPGIHPNVIAVAVGYGRQSIDKSRTSEYIGPAANGSGVNIYPFANYNGTSVIYHAPVTVEKTGTTYPIAQTQVHQITEG